MSRSELARAAPLDERNRLAMWSRASVRPAIAWRGRILVVEDDPHAAEIIRRALRALHLEGWWARSGAEAMVAARQASFDLVLNGLGKPIHPSDAVMIIVSALRAEDRPDHARDGLEHGGRPDAGLASSAVSATRRPPGSITERWAALMLRTIDATSDPKTITHWAKCVGVSRSALCEYCRLVHVSPHDARDFARLMRAICHSGDRWEPEAFLDFADVRTLKKLLSRAGLPGSQVMTPMVPEFFDRQQWIPRHNPGLIALRTLLGGSPQCVWP